jgi:hypothetical protein
VSTTVESELDRKLDQVRRLSNSYRSLFNWPTTVDNETCSISLRIGEVVDALTMRAGFAAEVNNILTVHMMRAPIIVAPGTPNDWIFLTQPRTELRASTWEDLIRIQVEWRQPGSLIVLPDEQNASQGRRWLTGPTVGRELPPWTAVVAAARSASTLRGGW